MGSHSKRTALSKWQFLTTPPPFHGFPFFLLTPFPYVIYKKLQTIEGKVFV